MAKYVDGFLIPVPVKSIAAYKRMSTAACKIWMDHGALEYIEAVGDDLKTKWAASFSKAVTAKKGETVVFSFIVFKSRKHRDTVNAKVMKDPRMAKMMDPKEIMPFDVKRMFYGGFKTIVDK